MDSKSRSVPVVVAVTIGAVCLVVGLIIGASVMAIAKRARQLPISGGGTGLQKSPEIQSAKPSVPPATPESNGVMEYVDASREWIKTSDILIMARSKGIGSVKLKDFNDEGETEEKYQRIEVILTHADENKLVHFRSWGSGFKSELTVRDDLGNRCAVIRTRFTQEVVGRPTGTVTIRAGQKVTDLIIVEKPVPKASFLLLDLPAKNFDGDGTLRLKVPLK